MDIVRTVDEIIDKLGGTTAAANALGFSPSRVSNWRTMGRFPDSVDVQNRLQKACEPFGIVPDVELFGWRETA